MAKTDKKIDAYILNAEDFAKPILIHLRELVHLACPEVEEGIKWSFPNFMYKGSILCSMASFKKHCAFTFWLGAKMKDPKNILESGGGKSAMGHLGKISSLEDLPSDKVLLSYVKEAMKLTESGEKITRKAPAKAAEVKVPPYFINALKENKKALSVFEGFSASHRKEYVQWVTEAKTQETRERRLKTAIEWLSEGKSRNWKYERK